MARERLKLNIVGTQRILYINSSNKDLLQEYYNLLSIQNDHEKDRLIELKEIFAHTVLFFSEKGLNRKHKLVNSYVRKKYRDHLIFLHVSEPIDWSKYSPETKEMVSNVVKNAIKDLDWLK